VYFPIKGFERLYDELLERGDDGRQQPVHALGERLHHQPVGVAIDDEGRQQVGFGVDQPVSGRLNTEGATKRDRRLDAPADQRLVGGSVAAGQDAQRDLRSIAVQSVGQRAAPRPSYQDHVAARSPDLRQVRAIDPRVSAAEALFAARGDADARGHGDIVQSPPVRIAIGSDHAGFLLKTHLTDTLRRLGHSVDDHGTDSEASVDYPPICFSVGRAVAEGRADRGVVLGGSGQGEQMAANKIAGVRAALCHDLFTARLSRQHNDANVLAMGGRIVAFALADEILALWLETPFEGGRHQRRIDQISAAERR